MKKPIFTVFDNVAKQYMAPIFAEATDGVAIRNIQTTMENSEHMFAKHPQDYTLVRVGTLDEETGTIDQNTKGDVIELKVLTKGE